MGLYDRDYMKADWEKKNIPKNNAYSKVVPFSYKPRRKKRIISSIIWIIAIGLALLCLFLYGNINKFVDGKYKSQSITTSQRAYKSTSYEKDYEVIYLTQDQAMVYYRQGIEYLNKGIYDKAMINFKKAISLNPKLYNTLIESFKFDTENFEGWDNLFLQLSVY